MSNSADTDFFRIFGRELHSTTCLFTDGSKVMDAPFTGFAISTVDGSISKQYRTAGFLSSFCVEAMAILEAIRLAKVQGCTPCTVFSDCKSVLTAIASKFNHKHSAFIILEIKRELAMLEDSGERCQLVWIPSHKGIVGNERADILAKEAIRVGRDTQIGVPLQEFKGLWKNKMFDELHEWCRKEGIIRGSFFVNNFLQNSKYTWFHKFNINRRTVATINRLRSGHTSLKSSLFRFHIVDSPLCDDCDEEETPNHVFWKCSRFSVQRNLLYKDLIKSRGFLPHSVEYLLATIDYDIIYALEKFINNIKIDI